MLLVGDRFQRIRSGGSLGGLPPRFRRSSLRKFPRGSPARELRKFLLRELSVSRAHHGNDSQAVETGREGKMRNPTKNPFGPNLCGIPLRIPVRDPPAGHPSKIPHLRAKAITLIRSFSSESARISKDLSILTFALSSRFRFFTGPDVCKCPD